MDTPLPAFAALSVIRDLRWCIRYARLQARIATTHPFIARVISSLTPSYNMSPSISSGSASLAPNEWLSYASQTLLTTPTSAVASLPSPPSQVGSFARLYTLPSAVRSVSAVPSTAADASSRFIARTVTAASTFVALPMNLLRRLLSPAILSFTGFMSLMILLLWLRSTGRLSPAYLTFALRRLWQRLWFGPEEVLSSRTLQSLDGVLAARNGFNADVDNNPVNGVLPPEPRPPAMLWGQADRIGPYAVSVSYQLKAEGLGSGGMDTLENRRIARLRASDIMKKHGVRPSDISRSAPMAVALAFVPLPEEIAARQLEFILTATDAKEAAARVWVDPRTVGGSLPTVVYN